MKKTREADNIYDIRAVCDSFKGKKLHADTSALCALRVIQFEYGFCLYLYAAIELYVLTFQLNGTIPLHMTYDLLQSPFSDRCCAKIPKMDEKSTI